MNFADHRRALKGLCVKLLFIHIPGATPAQYPSQYARPLKSTFRLI